MACRLPVVVVQDVLLVVGTYQGLYALMADEFFRLRRQWLIIRSPLSASFAGALCADSQLLGPFHLGLLLSTEAL